MQNMNNNMYMMQNINYNMGMVQNMNNNMGMMPNMNNNIEMIPNMNNNIEMIPNMNNNIGMIPNVYNEPQMQQQMMQQIMQQQIMEQQMMQQQALMQMQQIELNNPNPLTEKEKKEQEIQKNINNYYDSKKYEIDFKRIKNQITNFKKIIDILMKYIKHLEECIENNNKIMDNYIGKPYKNKNYINLLNLSSSIEDVYEDKIEELESNNNDIKNIFKLGIKELKDNYLNDFNTKYNLNLDDREKIGNNFNYLVNNKLNEVQFRELCRIDFKNIKELEIMFEDDIDISVLTKTTFHNLSYLSLHGKIKDINILTKLPFKLLENLNLSNNDFYNNNIEFFKNIPCNNLKNLTLNSNKINNIEGLSKAPFYGLIGLFLKNNSISTIKPLQEFPFRQLESLNLDNNLIENLEYLNNTKFDNLKRLSLAFNKINDITVLSKVNFMKIISLNLDHNQIRDIEILCEVPFTNLKSLFLRDNLIDNIGVFTKVPFVDLRFLKLTNNKIINFEILSNTSINTGLLVYVNRGQYSKIQIDINRHAFANNKKIKFIDEYY